MIVADRMTEIAATSAELRLRGSMLCLAGPDLRPTRLEPTADLRANHRLSRAQLVLLGGDAGSFCIEFLQPQLRLPAVEAHQQVALCDAVPRDDVDGRHPSRNLTAEGDDVGGDARVADVDVCPAVHQPLAQDGHPNQEQDAHHRESDQTARALAGLGGAGLDVILRRTFQAGAIVHPVHRCSSRSPMVCRTDMQVSRSPGEMPSSSSCRRLTTV